MNLLDASAVIAFFTAEPAAPAVRAVLEEGPVAMTAVQLAEVVDKLTRGRGVAPQVARQALDRMDLAIRPVTAETAWRAGAVRSRRYHRSRCAVSLADCVLVACASPDDRIVSSDRALLGIAQAEGVDVLELPSST